MRNLFFLFFLEKWYFDSVDKDGRVWIGYVARLQWLWLTVTYVQSFLSEKNVNDDFQSSFLPYPQPEIEEDSMTYASGLFTMSCSHPISVPFAERLLEELSGTFIDWYCIRANAAVSIKTRSNSVLHGRGYIERIAMTIKPWKLPIQELLWGRFTGKNHSLVWIAWRSNQDKIWIFCDGVKYTVGEISMENISVGNIRLEIEKCRMLLKSKPLKERLRSGLKFIRPFIPSSVANMDEEKWLSRGTLRIGADIDEGWVIHETVIFGSRV